MKCLFSFKVHSFLLFLSIIDVTFESYFLALDIVQLLRFDQELRGHELNCHMLLQGANGSGVDLIL